MEQEIEVLMQGYQFRKLYEKKYECFMEQYDLRKIDVEILIYLHFCGEHNIASDIQKLGLFTKGHISQSLERLVHAQLVYTKHDRKDKRVVHLFLSEKAEPIIKEAMQVKSEIFEQVFAGVTAEERKTLIEVARKVWNNIAQELE